MAQSSYQATSPHETALAYVRAGLSVIPIRPDGTKRPALSKWDAFQKQLPSEEAIRSWWQDGADGIAIIGGGVSGGLECLDFDRGELFEDWCQLVESQAPGLTARLSVVRTPRRPAGYHVRYRCRAVEIPGNMKLAQERGTDPKTGKPCLVTLIETRGEGGYALAPGSPPACHETGSTYEHIAGPQLMDLAEIASEERELLIAAARSFDLASAAKTKRSGASSKGEGAGVRPGDEYDRRGPDWAEILEPHGWERCTGRGTATYWRRPGKETSGYSATTGYCKGEDGADLLAVFSSNAHPFDGPNGTRPCTCYGKFAAFALLNHEGDFKAAARELASLGYGSQRNSRNGQPHESRGGEADHRPQITISTEEHEVNAEAVTALGTDEAIYQRGGMLVRVVRDVSPAAKGVRRPFAPRIEPMPPPLLRERLAANAR
jgi:putative DNA primase/helicase